MGNSRIIRGYCFEFFQQSIHPTTALRNSIIGYFIVESFDANDSIIYTGVDLEDGKFHHVVATFDGTDMKIYADGVFLLSKSNPGSLTNYNTDLFLGKYANITTVNNNSNMSNVQIWNKALTYNDIKCIYASMGAWYPKDGLVSSWSMENNGISTGQAHPNGSTIKDSFGVNNGTIFDGSDNSMTLESSPTRTKRGRR